MFETILRLAQKATKTQKIAQFKNENGTKMVHVYIYIYINKYIYISYTYLYYYYSLSPYLVYLVYTPPVFFVSIFLLIFLYGRGWSEFVQSGGGVSGGMITIMGVEHF